MHRLRLLLLDCALIALAGVFALLLRDNLEPSAARFAAFVPLLALTLAAAVIIFPAIGISRTIWRLTALNDYLRLLTAIVLTVLAAVALAFVYNRLQDVARAVPVLQAILMLVFLVGARVAMRVRHAARAKPMQLVAMPRPVGAPETILVVGLTRLTDLYLRSVAEFAPERVRIAGLLVRSPQHAGRSVHHYDVLGTPDQVASVVRDLEAHGVAVDRIVVTMAFDDLPETDRVALLDVERSSAIRLEFIAERLGLDQSGGDSRIAMGRSGFLPSAVAFIITDAELAAMARRPYWIVKRALDVLGACVLLLVFAPVMLCASVVVALDAGWPITFWQQRPGLGGRPFRLYKLRTMAAPHTDDGRSVPDDQRLSRTGRILRRLRIDELPQLLNILKGEMSFIGPRPLLSADQPSAYAARLLVRPGLTGWAQVKAGRDISAANKAALDVWYVRNASLALDLAIVAQTVRMLVIGERISSSAIRHAWRDLQRAGICGSSDWATGQRRLDTSTKVTSAKQAT
jgi:lipopolysaccharide/colanic/teichoic acid biosynthesis glycosyltransferase